MTETDFIFDGIKLSDFGYIVAGDGVLDEDGVVSGMAFTTIKSARSDTIHRVAHTYEECYQADVAIIKRPCDQDNLDLTNDDISEMTRWLCRKEYKWFRWIDDIGQDEIWFEVQIGLDKIMYGTSVIGLRLHIKANRPYGLSKEKQHIWNNAQGTHDIYLDTDEEGYITPDLTITVRQNGKIMIGNNYDNRIFILDNCITGEIITVHGGDTLQISSTNANHLYMTDFNYKWLRLYNEFSNNHNVITVEGNCNVVLTYRTIRKVGI